MLADRKAHYEKTGESLQNTPAQYKKEFPWLKEVDSLALANVQLNLNKAYKSSSQVLVFLASRLKRLLNLIRRTIKKELLLY